MIPNTDPSGTVKPSDLAAALLAVDTSSITPELKQSVSLFTGLFLDVARVFPNYVTQDLQYLVERTAREGKGFILETLPMLGKAFETCLITQKALIVPDGFKIRRGTRLPVFLHELFREVLSKDTGVPLSQFDYGHLPKRRNSDDFDKADYAVYFIRQICLMWSKVETSVSAEKQKNCLDSFVKRISTVPDISLDSEIARETRAILTRVFSTTSETLDELKAFVTKPWGRQGPGAVAGRERGSDKWSFLEWPGLPKDLFLWNGKNYIQSEFVPKQPPSRVCLVPKDFRSPRVICIEPKENQFAQQGLMDILYRHCHEVPITRRSISFIDTARSRGMCYNYTYATIDLKDASDTVSVKLARLVLPRWIFRLVTRYRTRQVSVSSKTILSHCLATMGNATCFPLETLIFWAISTAVVENIWRSHSSTVRQHLKRDVRVFGDDIIVPLWACEAVSESLIAAGFSINESKTCSFSLVRESCGEWVFNGKVNKIVRFRSLNVKDHRSFIQWLDQITDLGDWCNTHHLYETVFTALHQYKDLIRKTYPTFLRRRFNTDLWRVEMYVPQFVQRGRISGLEDYAGLYAWHVQNCRTPFLSGARKRVKMSWQSVSHKWIQFITTSEEGLEENRLGFIPMICGRNARKNNKAFKSRGTDMSQ